MNQIIKTTPKDFFLNLGATVSLYISAGSLISLVFSIINYYYPDQLAGYFYSGSIAWPISILFVLVPILYVLEWLINKDVKATPEKADLWIRKWRIYFTLFLVVVLIGGDLITLINTYLNGEISSRFVYKIISILFIGGMIGKYYFFNYYTNFKLSKIAQRVNAWAGIIIVIAAIVTGFILVGSPSKQRAIKFDNQRISDLQAIQYKITDYYQQKAKLPATLVELNDPLYGTIIPNDPENKSAYEYAAKDKYTFQLCTTFAYPYQDNAGRGSYDGGIDMSYPTGSIGLDTNWKHEAGHTCYSRTIDPEKYPISNADSDIR